MAESVAAFIITRFQVHVWVLFAPVVPKHRISCSLSHGRNSTIRVTHIDSKPKIITRPLECHCDIMISCKIYDTIPLRRGKLKLIKIFSLLRLACHHWSKGLLFKSFEDFSRHYFWKKKGIPKRALQSQVGVQIPRVTHITSHNSLTSTSHMAPQPETGQQMHLICTWSYGNLKAFGKNTEC